MLQKLLCLLIVTVAMTLSFCTTAKKASSGNSKDVSDAMYSYAEDVAPLIGQYCAPCHFPDGGKLKFLDTQKAIANNIDDIIYRVGLAPGQENFMPAGSETGLSAAQIQMLKDWKSKGMQ